MTRQVIVEGDVYKMADISGIGPRVETIIIPYVGPTLNKIWSGLHYRQRTKIADEAHLICKIAMKDIRPFSMPVHLEFTATMGKELGTDRKPRQRRLLDCSNYAVSNKLLEDALIVAGIIEDDSPKFVHSVKTCLPQRGPDSFTTLVITESYL